jgi:hypothetical protein
VGKSDPADSSGAGAAHEEADQEKKRSDHSQDEEPLHDEAKPYPDDDQNEEKDQ